MSKLRFSIAITVLLGSCLIGRAGLGSLFVQAQEATASQTQRPSDAVSREPAPAQEAAHNPGEAKKGQQSSEEEELRNSPIVRSIAEKTGLSANQVYWGCVLINFGIVLFLVVYVARKKLPLIFRTRTEAIQKHLEEARKTSEEARRRLSEVESRLSRLDIEIGAMRRQAEENARAEDQRILAESEQERRRIVEAAEQEITMAANAARRELQAYAADLAVDLAGKKIRVAPETDQTLVREFTSWLGKDGN